MEAYLNELSLHAQFQDIEAIGEAIRRINLILVRLTQLPQIPRLLYDSQLYYAPTTTDQASFSSSLKHVPDKAIQIQFKRLFKDRLNAQLWVDEMRQEECAYAWREQDVRGSSVAELTERCLQNGRGFLLNFSPSRFGSGTASVLKQGGAPTELDLVNSVDDLLTWCKKFPDIFYVTYDSKSERPPLDHETILRDKGRFRRTSNLVQGRVVYREIRSGSYWYVDNLHVGVAAHLEVFNAGRSHMGEATPDGALDQTKTDPAKTLAF